MRPEQEKSDWDFTPVINLLYILSIKGEGVTGTSHSQLEVSSRPVAPSTPVDAGSSLGNFDKLWKYLGQPLDVPLPSGSRPDDGNTHAIPIENVSTDEQRLNIRPPISKGVRWRDEIRAAGLEDKEADSCLDWLRLSKSQRKKKRRRAKKKLDAQDCLLESTAISDTESDVEFKSLRHPPDRRAVIHKFLHGESQQDPARGVTHYISPPSSLSLPKPLQTLPDRRTRQTSKSHLDPDALSFQSIEQDSLTLAATKKAAIIAKLSSLFPQDKSHIDDSYLTDRPEKVENGRPGGLHIFVDASNIMIGFHNALKIARGLSISSRLRFQPLSFHNLSLVLERGRPTAKRVLVGSDSFPTIAEAEKIGYETNILQRVHKAKLLTAREKRFRNGNGTSGQSSGSETNATHAPEKWVEQAVDEILHLKILESVVDAVEPSTIVLATGDAAEAEYSQGFLRMVERALEKGWVIELVSFRHNISGAYKRKEFRLKWANRFKIIELDGYVQELLAT